MLELVSHDDIGMLGVKGQCVDWLRLRLVLGSGIGSRRVLLLARVQRYFPSVDLLPHL